jgi:hypothetical protein
MNTVAARSPKQPALTTHDSHGTVLEHLILSLGIRISERRCRLMIARLTVGTLHKQPRRGAGVRRVFHRQSPASNANSAAWTQRRDCCGVVSELGQREEGGWTWVPRKSCRRAIPRPCFIAFRRSSPAPVTDPGCRIPADTARSAPGPLRSRLERPLHAGMRDRRVHSAIVGLPLRHSLRCGPSLQHSVAP